MPDFGASVIAVAGQFTGDTPVRRTGGAVDDASIGPIPGRFASLETAYHCRFEPTAPHYVLLSLRRRQVPDAAVSLTFWARLLFIIITDETFFGLITVTRLDLTLAGPRDGDAVDACVRDRRTNKSAGVPYHQFRYLRRHCSIASMHTIKNVTHVMSHCMVSIRWGSTRLNIIYIQMGEKLLETGFNTITY